MKINENIKSSNYATCKNARQIEYVILHYTDQNFDDSVESLTSKEKEVSAHYLIAQDGEIFNLVADEHVAWHAGTGKSSWHGKDYINTFSIGIEIVNLGYEPFPNIQMKSVIELCNHLKGKYNIPRENFIGHSDIAPDRKLDPGIYFDWKRLSDEGIGIEFDIVSGLPHQRYEPPLNNIGQLQTRLSLIGYKIEITGNVDKQTSDVIRAFKAHFCPEVIFESHGIEKYRDFDSKYDWDNISEKILKKILLKK